MPTIPRPMVLGAVLATFAAALLVWLFAGPSAKPAAKGGAPTVTVSAPVTRAVVDWNEYTGQFAAVEFVELRARVGGTLTEIHFTDGQMVKKGDPLFVIDPRPYEIALASAQARLDQAGSSQVFAHRQLGRAGELREKDFVSQSVVDQRVQESRGAGAGVDGARAAVRDAELNLEFTRIVAPVSGRVGTHEVSVGNLINANGTRLTTIVSLDPIHFDFDISEADYLGLQRGALAEGKMPEVEIRLADETGWPRKGRLDFIDNRIDRGAGTIRARAVFDNADHFIAPGVFGRIRLAASASYQALLVPDASVVTDQQRKLVMTVTADGTVVPKPVTLGPLVDGLRVVRGGLGPDDRVVINGLMRARPGGKVTPQPGTIDSPSQPK